MNFTSCEIFAPDCIELCDNNHKMGQYKRAVFCTLSKAFAFLGITIYTGDVSDSWKQLGW